jgi:predicted enzyme related to lactoylglutathione lyase
MASPSPAPTFFGPVLLARDFELTVDFYRRIIGLPVEGRAPYARCISKPSTFSIADGNWWAQINGDENPVQDESPVSNLVLVIQVSDLEAVFERLMALEVKFLFPPTLRPALGARNAFLRDPDGRFVALTETLP